MTHELLPWFRYHPDPVASGVVKAGPEECICCGRSRGYIYTGPAYGEEEFKDCLCPWCIADGSAAGQLGASFADTHALARAGISQEIRAQIEQRTPGYVSWQPENWLSHCADACAFHGDLSPEELEQLPEQVRTLLMKNYRIAESAWPGFVKGYRKGGDPALYKFVCLHCGALLVGMDRS